MQYESYGAEIEQLKIVVALKKNSALRSLDPFLYKNLLPHVFGRLTNISLPLEKKHFPIVLSGLPFIRLHFRYIQEKYYHMWESSFSYSLSNLWIFDVQSLHKYGERYNL